MLGKTLLFLCILFAAACGGNDEPSVPDEVTGVIVDIRAERLDLIEGFTLKAGDDRYEIDIDPDRSYGFALSHLHEHLVTSEPVVVELEERDGRLIAVTIEDA